MKKQNVLHIVYKSAACHYNCHALLLKAIFCWHYAHVAKMCLDLSKSGESSDKKFSNFHVLLCNICFSYFSFDLKRILSMFNNFFHAEMLHLGQGQNCNLNLLLFKSCHHFLSTNSSHFRCLLHTSHTYFCK